MPAVLWGVACLSLPGPTTAADVTREFREAVIRGVGVKSSSSEICGDNCLPRVDLYRLVRIEDQTECRLTGEEQVVAHLPDSPWGCRDIEEMYRQQDEAEIRYDRARESLVSLMESLDFGEVATSPSIGCQDVGQVLSTQGLPMSPQAQQLCNVLRQENKVLRYKLNQSAVIQQELRETAEMLRREFMLLARDTMLTLDRSRQQTTLPRDGENTSALSAVAASCGETKLQQSLEVPPSAPRADQSSPSDPSTSVSSTIGVTGAHSADAVNHTQAVLGTLPLSSASKQAGAAPQGLLRPGIPGLALNSSLNSLQSSAPRRGSPLSPH